MFGVWTLNADDEYYSKSCLQCKTMVNLCIWWGAEDWRMLVVSSLYQSVIFVTTNKRWRWILFLFIYFFFVEVTFYNFPFVMFVNIEYSVMVEYGVFQVQVFLHRSTPPFVYLLSVCQCFLINNNSNILGAWPKRSKLIVGLFSYLLSRTTDSIFLTFFLAWLQFAWGAFTKTYQNSVYRKIIAILVWVH